MIDLKREIRHLPPGDPGPEPLHIGVVYPNTYQVALASLAFQTVHLIAATMPEIVAHRICLENANGKEYPQRTLEERLEIRSLAALLISCSFELDYCHLLRILHASGIQPLRRKRGAPPLIIVGGIAPTSNPEPIAPFADAIAIGEAEEMLPALLEELKDCFPLLTGPRFNTGRQELYEAWDQIEGVYVPALWEDGAGRFSDREAKRLRQVVVPELDRYPSFTAVISPDGVYGAKNLVEISRGCTTRCRFCLISYISPAGPGRTRSMASVLENARRFPPEEASIGLVASSVSDHPDIVPTINGLADDGYEVSVSSVKISSTSHELIDALSRAGAKSVTYAPEHGSDRIRGIICKEYTYEDVRSRVEWAFDAGLKRVKLYFLTGFEEETDEDIKATPEFVLSLAQDLGLSTRPQGFQFTVGLASLVPKPCTPFQRRAMEEESVLKRKMKRMLDPLRKHPRIEIESESPRASLMQGALSQGDRSLAGYLMDVAASRGPILKSWDEAMFKLGDHPMKRVLSPRKADEKLPWGFIRRPGLDL